MLLPEIIIANHLGKGFVMPAVIDSNFVLSNLEQAIQQSFKRGSTPKASEDEEDGKSRISRVRLP